MNKKLKKLSLYSLILALLLFLFSFIMYHYLTPEFTFTTVWQAEANKPFVTLLFAIWGVFFLFSSVMSLMIAKIFYPKILSNTNNHIDIQE